MNEQEYARVIGQNLKRLLYESGRTQTEVCADLGIKKTTMSSWVNGARIMTIGIMRLSATQKKTPSHHWERVSSLCI